MKNREQMIELLTGVQSSKRNYYTELKKTIHELQKKNTQLEIINELMKSFNVDMSMDNMLKHVLEKLKTIFPIDRISLSLLHGGELVLANIYPFESFELTIGSLHPTKNSLYWHVLQSSEPYYHLVETNKNHEAWFEDHAFSKLNLVAVNLFPLISKGHVKGILSLGSKVKMDIHLSDRAFFQQLADQLAVCLENVRLFNELLETKKQWEETFQAVSDAIFMVDVNGKLIQANHSAFQYLSEMQNLTELNVDQLLFTEEVNPFKETILTKSPSSSKLHIDKKVCECYCFPIFNDANQLYATIIYIKDVTAKSRIEAQLIQSGKLAAIGEMAAGVAHELNNPLTAIMGNSQLLLRKLDLPDSSYKLLEDIYECGKRSKNIIRNLLTFSRQDEYLFEKCSVNVAASQVISLVGNQLYKQAIEIETRFTPSLPLIDGSCQQIGQIILNLLLNAKDALEDSKRNGKKIVLQTYLQEEDGFKKIILTVEDNGCGIEASVISEIFHPFFTTKNGLKGNGLGLSVSLGIAEAHGGTLEAESTLGEGSTFKLLLPIND
ncbi:sensor histidine kinase [Bacillus sp. JJ1764]|uniref:sensor histidine kinase n=1 Tax=Bacillus sp. JJ1764 TaxID=3122964 RepID=UPI002FFE7098